MSELTLAVRMEFAFGQALLDLVDLLPCQEGEGILTWKLLYSFAAAQDYPHSTSHST